MEKYDLIERFVTITNESDQSIVIEEIYSGQLHIPYENLTFRNTHGHWGAEQQMFKQNVSYGKITIENRKGVSGHNNNPYFIPFLFINFILYNLSFILPYSNYYLQ